MLWPPSLCWFGVVLVGCGFCLGVLANENRANALFSSLCFHRESESNTTHQRSVVDLRRERIDLSGICAVRFLVWVCFMLVLGVLLLLCFVWGIFGLLVFKWAGFQGGCMLQSSQRQELQKPNKSYLILIFCLLLCRSLSTHNIKAKPISFSPQSTETHSFLRCQQWNVFSKFN